MLNENTYLESSLVFLPHAEVLSSGSIKITFRAAKTQITGTHPSFNKVPEWWKCCCFRTTAWEPRDWRFRWRFSRFSRTSLLRPLQAEWIHGLLSFLPSGNYHCCNHFITPGWNTLLKHQPASSVSCWKVAFTFLSLSQPQMNAGTAVVINKPPLV